MWPLAVEGRSGEELAEIPIEHAGVADRDASGMWDLRQVVHGKSVFTARRLDELTRLCATLRAAVLLLLKRTLNDPLEAPPILLGAGDPILSTLMALTGHGPLDDETVRRVTLLEQIRTAASP